MAGDDRQLAVVNGSSERCWELVGGWDMVGWRWFEKWWVVGGSERWEVVGGDGRW